MVPKSTLLAKSHASKSLFLWECGDTRQPCKNEHFLTKHVNYDVLFYSFALHFNSNEQKKYSLTGLSQLSSTKRISCAFTSIPANQRDIKYYMIRHEYRKVINAYRWPWIFFIDINIFMHSIIINLSVKHFWHQGI